MAQQAKRSCSNCGGDVVIMTPPQIDICSENCLKEYKEKQTVHRAAHDTSQSPRPQRGTQNFNGN